MQLLSSSLTTAVPMSPSGMITASPLWVNNGDGDLFVASGQANNFNDASLLGGKFLMEKIGKFGKLGNQDEGLVLAP